MKTSIVVGVLFALFITVEPICNSGACSLTSFSCACYQTYISCLTPESVSCTSSQTTQKAAIDAIILANNLAKGILGCGAAASVPISIATMVLGILAVIIKS